MQIEDLIGVEKYIDSLNKWYSNLNKIFITSIEGKTGIGKSTLAESFLLSKNYNIIYFDVSSVKSKNIINEKIQQSFKSYDIFNMLSDIKKENAYIIDNIEANTYSKSDINELYNLFAKNKAIRPVIMIGTYNKNTNFPKKKIYTIKMYNPTETTLLKIGQKYILQNNLTIKNLNLKLIVSKCQYDIKKLLILLEENNNKKKISDIVIKNCSYNLFTDFQNLINNYKKIDSTDILNDQIILLAYTFHQNLYNIILQNTNKPTDYLFEFNNDIIESLTYEHYMLKYYNYEFLNYMYFIGPKKISYNFNKIKINKNISIDVDYPKYCYISNQKNIYLKLIQIFKESEYYECINEDNFKLFIQCLFKNKESELYLSLKKEQIETLSKII